MVLYDFNATGLKDDKKNLTICRTVFASLNVHAVILYFSSFAASSSFCWIIYFIRITRWETFFAGRFGFLLYVSSNRSAVTLMKTLSTKCSLSLSVCQWVLNKSNEKKSRRSFWLQRHIDRIYLKSSCYMGAEEGGSTKKRKKKKTKRKTTVIWAKNFAHTEKKASRLIVTEILRKKSGKLK